MKLKYLDSETFERRMLCLRDLHMPRMADSLSIAATDGDLPRVLRVLRSNVERDMTIRMVEAVQKAAVLAVLGDLIDDVEEAVLFAWHKAEITEGQAATALNLDRVSARIRVDAWCERNGVDFWSGLDPVLDNAGVRRRNAVQEFGVPDVIDLAAVRDLLAKIGPGAPRVSVSPDVHALILVATPDLAEFVEVNAYLPPRTWLKIPAVPSPAAEFVDELRGRLLHLYHGAVELPKMSTMIVRSDCIGEAPAAEPARVARGQDHCCYCAAPTNGWLVGAGDGSCTGANGFFACRYCAGVHGLATVIPSLRPFNSRERGE